MLYWKFRNVTKLNIFSLKVLQTHFRIFWRQVYSEVGYKCAIEIKQFRADSDDLAVLFSLSNVSATNQMHNSAKHANLYTISFIWLFYFHTVQ